jgi:hypothetical protein
MGVWVVMVAAEWVAVAVLYHSELVIGSVALKAADTTTLPKMSAVSDVAPAVRVQPLWRTRVILLQWILHRTMAWARAQWQALQALGLSHQLLEGLDLAVGMEDSILVVRQAPMLSHLVSVLRLAHTLPSTPILALLEAHTLPVPLTAELLRQRSSLQAMDRHRQAPPTTSIPTRVKAILLLFSPRASVICQ